MCSSMNKTSCDFSKLYFTVFFFVLFASMYIFDFIMNYDVIYNVYYSEFLGMNGIFHMLFGFMGDRSNSPTGKRKPDQ